MADPFLEAEGAGERYNERLASATRAETGLARDLEARQAAETNRMFREQQALMERDAFGASAAAGGDPSRLRAGQYAMAQGRQQGANELAVLQAIEDQAAREQMLGVYGRQGQYVSSALGAASGLYAGAASNWASETERIQQQIAAEQAQTMGYAGMGTGMIGALMGAVASDRDLKTQIREASPREQDEALRSLMGELDATGRRTDDRLAAADVRVPAYTYQYRPEAAGMPGVTPGKQFGPMAQDLERHPLTAPMVQDTPRGKVVDTGAAALGSLSLASRANEKVDRLAAALEAEGALTDEELRRRAGGY